jgi:hypothetical protein
VEDHRAGQRLDRLDAPALDQLVDDLRVVHDLVGPAELGELVLDGVEAVRAVRDDLAELVLVERLHVLVCSVW